MLSLSRIGRSPKATSIACRLSLHLDCACSRLDSYLHRRRNAEVAPTEKISDASAAGSTPHVLSTEPNLALQQSSRVAAEDYSFKTYDAFIADIAALMQPATVLDIGAGSGKYGRLLRGVVPDSKIIAVEVDVDSINDHKLHQLYSEIIEIEAGRLITEMPTISVELAVLGDVIEHLPKSAGIDLLNWLHYRTSYTVIVTPEHMPMSRAPWYTGHNSWWSHRDFTWHDNWASHRALQMQLFILRGLGPAKVTLNHMVDAINAKSMTVVETDDLVTAPIQLHRSVESRTTDAGNTYRWRPD